MTMEASVHNKKDRRTMKTFTTLCLSILTFSAVLTLESAKADDEFNPSRAPVEATRQMIVAGHPLAAEAGLEMLREGGSAADAAIAAQMVLNLVEPQSSGIGGGGFLLHYSAANAFVNAYDGRETAPAAATPDRFLDENSQPRSRADVIPGGLSVGVPGLVAMLELVHADHGVLPWARLFEPAIELAENGFPVSERLSRMLSEAGPDIFADSARAYFFDESGAARPSGFVLKNPELADTLRRIATEGGDAFYLGEIARDIAVAVRSSTTNPGDMTPQDIADYVAHRRQPVCGRYQRRTICGMGPPSSGALTILQTLALAERPFMGRQFSARALHLVAEAGKLAFADRNRFIADSDFVDIPDLLDPDYLSERRNLISTSRTMGRAEAGTPPDAPRAGRDGTRTSPGTTHLSVVDADGNAVALTSTIETRFGSRVMVRGFLLNNELTDFSFAFEDDEGSPIANRVEPGKRPRSSMAPTLVFAPEGDLEMVLGAPGGSLIIPYVVKAIIGHVDWSLDAQTIVELPNFAGRNRAFEIEERYANMPVIDQLRALGHEIRTRPMPSGLNVIIRKSDGRLEGGADPRREGMAAGD